MAPKLQTFDALAGVPCYYARVNAAYGDLSKCTKTRKRKLTAEFIKRLGACIAELDWICQGGGLGPLKAITSGGAYVAKAGWHGKGRAYDLGGLHWADHVMPTLEVARDFHAGVGPDHFDGQSMDFLLYLGCEAVLRRHFGTVLGLHYNKAHWNHWHIDPGTPVGYRGSGFGATTRVTFLQEVLRHVHGVDPGPTDGKEGELTRTATLVVCSGLSLGALTDPEQWKQFLLLTAMMAVQL